MEAMTRAEFATLPSGDRLEACVTFEHGPDRAAIRHDIRCATVGYILALYPTFDSIEIIRFD